MSKQHIFSTFLLILCLCLVACKEDKFYVFEVNPVEVTQTGVDKNNLKSDLEFLSLAFSDLFGESISQEVLANMVNAYTSKGDKQLIADLIIRNMLERPEAEVPTSNQMRQDIDLFIQQTYKKFYVRDPGEYERWYFKNLIENDPDITPEMIYYSFLSSDEYRFF